MLWNEPKVGGPHGTWDLLEGTPGYAPLVRDLTGAVEFVGSRCDYVCVACNTLHALQPEIEAFLRVNRVPTSFVSIIDCVAAHLGQQNPQSVAVLGSRLTTDLSGPGALSPYSRLADSTRIEAADDAVRDQMQWVIGAVKTRGADDEETLDVFQRIVDRVEADVLVLACTEYPLLVDRIATRGKIVVDPTQILCDRLVELSCADSEEEEALGSVASMAGSECTRTDYAK